MRLSFLRTRRAIVSGLIVCMSGCLASAQQLTPLPDIREFVQQSYIHGVPYELAYRYDRRAATELLKMLQDSNMSQLWPNIVVTLGMIGDESAVQPLIDFLVQGRGESSREHYAARTSVLLALGYLANKSGSDAALSFLTESVDPSVWTDRNVRWSSPYQDATGRDEQLSTMAILGLALSGLDSARETLMELQRPAAEKANERFARAAADVAASALEDHRYISERGMLDYATRKSGPEPQPVGLVTGAEGPPDVITGRSRVPQPPRPSMDAPNLPPEPERREAPAIPEAELLEPPDIEEGNQ